MKPDYINTQIGDKSYICESMDFSTLNAFKKFLLKNNSEEQKKLKDAFYKKLDVDFVNQSQRIEQVKVKDSKSFYELLGIYDTDVVYERPFNFNRTNNTFTKADFERAKHFKVIDRKNPNNVVVRSIAMRENNQSEDFHFTEKVYLLASTIIASNARLNDTKKYHNNGHLLAVSHMIRCAKKARREKANYLNNDMIKYLHECLFLNFEKTVFVEESGDTFFTESLQNNFAGKFRDKDSGGLTTITGAHWTPTSNSSVEKNMQELIDWYKYSCEKENIHPIVRAAILHTRFIKIHPFKDGNGRVARLLVNYELVRNQFPTVTIKFKHRKEYIQALDGVLSNEKDGVYDVSKFAELLYSCMIDRMNLISDKVIKPNRNMANNENIFLR